jgi:Domain of unknown function (DUF4188)
VAARADGLLLHENLFYSLFPLHLGMRQICAILNRLNASHGQTPSRIVETVFAEHRGTGFWHELYSVPGGFESIYVDVQRPIRFLCFAQTVTAKGPLASDPFG